MATETREIKVYADWLGMPHALPIGDLRSERIRGSEVFSFMYSDDWLTNDLAQVIDPELQLYKGRQFLNDKAKTNFGIFTDSAPDRWGRLLMRRREAAIARSENRKENMLFETDYLLGVYDAHRMGALRFKLSEQGPYLSDSREFVTPPWASIRELEEISLKLEDENVADDPEYLRWLNMLIAPGSSLGGARPKAGVVDKDGHLWIAKFPSKSDEGNTGAWELVTHKMARNCGMKVPEAMARKFSSQHHTFLTKRFDRTDNGSRLHFASAMTLLGYTDGIDYNDGVSYLELVDFIVTRGADVRNDLHELWRRIVFSMCVSNTDDHLRNHGFLLTRRGWLLSPAYDINPVETGNGLKLNVSENDNAINLDLSMDVAPYFRLKTDEARLIVQQVVDAVKPWRSLAETAGIRKNEIQLKANAFRLADN
jgi:serine/threonine-protein kinase HipA